MDYLRVCRNFTGNLEHCNTIDFRIELATPDEVSSCVSYQQELVGDPDSGVIHGGLISTMMDTGMACAITCHLLAQGEPFELMPTLDLRVDYMRPAKPGLDIRVTSKCYRLTSSVAFARAIAFQESDQRPIALGTATFMRIGPEMLPNSYIEKVMQGVKESSNAG